MWKEMCRKGKKEKEILLWNKEDPNEYEEDK